MVIENFSYYRDQVFDLYNAREYREALAVAFQAKEKFPERDAKTSYWIGCLESRLGESSRLDTTVIEVSQRLGARFREHGRVMQITSEDLKHLSETRLPT